MEHNMNYDVERSLRQVKNRLRRLKITAIATSCLAVLALASAVLSLGMNSLQVPGFQTTTIPTTMAPTTLVPTPTSLTQSPVCPFDCEHCALLEESVTVTTTSA